VVGRHIRRYNPGIYTREARRGLFTLIYTPREARRGLYTRVYTPGRLEEASQDR